MSRAYAMATNTWHECVKKSPPPMRVTIRVKKSHPPMRNGLQVWRKLVRIVNALVSQKGIGNVSSTVNRFNRGDIYEFFRGIGYHVGIFPIPTWNKLNDNRIFSVVADIMFDISGVRVSTMVAARIICRTIGCSYKFIDDVAVKLRVPKHIKFIIH
jgi:hypothetical protein